MISIDGAMEKEDKDENGKKRSRTTSTNPSSSSSEVVSHVSNFLQRMFDPSITKGLESRLPLNSLDLIHVPWKLQLEKDETAVQRTVDDDDEEEHPDNSSGDNSKSSSVHVYPPLHYLDLRKLQNKQWATSRLHEGIRQQMAGNYAKAEACYQEGLDLVPTHAPLLVAYGALCANIGRTQEAITKLETALEVDPQVANAQSYLDAITKRQQQQQQAIDPKRQAGSVARAEQAMKDAMMEQSFLQTETTNNKAEENQSIEKYSLVYAASDSDYQKEKQKRKKKRDRSKHRKSRSKRKHKRRHHREHESSDVEESLNDESKRPKRRKRRHRYERDISKETSEESSRRRHRRRHDSVSSENSSSSSRDRERRKEKRRKDRTHVRRRESPAGSSAGSNNKS